MKVPMTSEILKMDCEQAKSVPTTEKFVKSQKANAYFQKVATMVGKPGSSFKCDRNGFLVLSYTLDGAGQWVVPV